MNKKLATSTVLAASMLAIPTAALAHDYAATTDEPAFCAPYQQAVAMFSGGGDVDPAAAEAVVAEMSANIPTEIAEPAGVIVDTVTRVLAEGPQVFDEVPEFFPSLGAVDGWVFDNCAFDARFDVLATDFAFGGLPEELPAGRVALRLTNEGAEIHEIAILRKVDGAEMSWDEIAMLAATEDPAVEDVAEFVGAAFSPDAETPGVAVVDLEPGEYAAICFIPVGSLQGEQQDEGQGEPESESEPEAEGEGGPGASLAEAEYDPHFAHGMIQVFTVGEAG